jgi:small subunit ribosomal protein S17
MTQTAEQAGGRQEPSHWVGVVKKKSSDKTIRVDINTLLKHAKYGKYLRRRTRLAVHDPAGAAREGDVVEIAPCRRLSRTKSWRLVRVVRSGGPALEPVAEPAVALRPDAGTDKG